jgi:pimeloyl-ACP methyl ester carboxylesterase
MPYAEVPLTAGTSTVHYHLTGRGPALVAVHGTGASAELNWAPLMESLADRFTILALDLSGSGRTTDPGGPILLEDLVAQVAGAALHAGLQRFHLVGHSLGAVVALAAAGRHPDLVQSVTAHGGWVRADPALDFQCRLWKRLAAEDVGALARLILLTAIGKETLRAWSEEDFTLGAEGLSEALTGATTGFARQAEADRTLDLTPYLAAITAPTLLLSSVDDRIIPPYHQQELSDLLPNATLLRVPGGHGLPAENPQLLAERTATHAGSVE